MRFYVCVIIIGLLNVLGTNTSPTRFKSSSSGLDRRNPVYAVHSNGGQRYQAVEPHTSPISAADLNAKSKQFYTDVTKEHDGKQYPPNMVSSQKHGDNIFHSSTERVLPNQPGMDQAQKYKETSQKKTDEIKAKPKDSFPKEDQKWKGKVDKGDATVDHRAKGKCSEGGTCGMVEAKHDKDVSMAGDKISSYGVKSGAEPTHHEGCTTDNPRKFGCGDVIAQHKMDDVNKPGRPASPPPRPGTPPPESPGRAHSPQRPK
ncbi:MAG: hypothetical protein Q9187_008509 [Circinaria calcarea]